jgi:hypothetical protein
MTMALSTRILGHPAVLALDLTLIEDWRKLGKFFVKAFDDGGRKYPKDFVRARVWLKYGRRDNALRTMKSFLTVDADYTCQPGRVLMGEGSSALTGSTPDRYFLTTTAFEHFAMQARTEDGGLVRRFFMAIRDAYVELSAVPTSVQPALTREAALVMAYHEKNCIYVGEIQAGGPGVWRLCKFGRTSDLAGRCVSNRASFSTPYYFELLHVAEVEKCVRAERVFRDLPEIRPNLQRTIINGIERKEVFVAPDSLTARKMEACLRRAAWRSASEDLRMAFPG